VHPNGIPCPLDLVRGPSGNTADPDGPLNLLLAPAGRADVSIDFNGVPACTSEMGWKETVQMSPGEVATVIMQFNPPDIVLKDGKEALLEYKPVYRHKRPIRIPSFLKGIDKYEVFLNGKEL